MSFEKQKLSPEVIKALKIGRPPNITRLFPYSRALIVSGKVIDRATIEKGSVLGRWVGEKLRSYSRRRVERSSQKAKGPLDPERGSQMGQQGKNRANSKQVFVSLFRLKAGLQGFEIEIRRNQV
jgi:hypothetical protein